MKTKISVLFSVILSLSLFITTHVQGAQDDTVKIVRTNAIPVIDGSGDDACWTATTWQAIDEVWIPWGGSVPASDYTGRYKVLWSQEQNLLYFLVEISDDVLVGEYEQGVSSGVYNFDIIEVFLDENKSGGIHMNDIGEQNAENAFAYHIFCEFPSGTETISDIIVEDTPGDNWPDHDFADHLPEFAITRSGNTCIREFSLKVYDDTYVGTNPESSKVQLAEGKIMGMSLAYCDNDDASEEPKERDNFFGSVQVSEAAYNDHWMNADDFGLVMLDGLGSIQSVKTNLSADNSYKIHYDPVSKIISVDTNNGFSGIIEYSL